MESKKPFTVETLELVYPMIFGCLMMILSFIGFYEYKLLLGIGIYVLGMVVTFGRLFSLLKGGVTPS